MVELMITPPRLQVKNVAFELTTSPASTEITTLNNVLKRSPALSHSPRSSFSQYPNRPSGIPSPLRRVELSILQSSPSPRRVPLKIISNNKKSLIRPVERSLPEEEVRGISLDSPGVTRLIPRFSNENFVSEPFLRMNLDDSLQGSQLPIIPPLLSRRRISSNKILNKMDTISNLPAKCATKHPTINKYPPCPSYDTNDMIESELGDEMNELSHVFLIERPKDSEHPGRNVSERARNHRPKNINTAKNSRVTNPIKRQDFMKLSDDDSRSQHVINENEEEHKPPIKMLSLGQRIGNTKPYSQGNDYSHHRQAQKSPLSLESLPNEDHDFILQDTSERDWNEIVGSLSDDDDDLNFFILTSPKSCFRESIFEVKGTESLNNPIGIRPCSQSSNSSSEKSPKFDRTSCLRRNQSDQSLNSIGIYLEGIPLCSEFESRHTITPPPTYNNSLIPPPMKRWS